MKKILLAVAITYWGGSFYAHSSVIQLTDHELAQVEGQALINLTITSPAQANSLMQAANIGFYKLATNAEIDLNINVHKLQLGCGGVNGSGLCDIDMDYLSLSGISESSEGRASSSAKISNPFIEFAIKNPDSSAIREVVGFRLSAEHVQGLLSLGVENSALPGGINRFSGFMKIQSGIGSSEAERSQLKGYASTEAVYMDLSKYPIHGRMSALLGIATVDFSTNGGGFNIPQMNNLPFEMGTLVLNGSRKSNVSLTATVNIPTIHLGVGSAYPSQGRVTSNPQDPYQSTTGVYTAGTPVDAVVTACTGPILNIACIAAIPGREFSGIKMNGTVEGAQAQVNFTEALGFIHKIEVNSPFSLSLQRDQVRWPEAEEANIAQPGWWLAISDPISIGEIMPEDRLNIEPLLDQFAQQAGHYLNEHPAMTNDILGVLLGSGLDVNIGTIRPAQKLAMSLNDLQLKGQNFAPNCFGGHKFC